MLSLLIGCLVGVMATHFLCKEELLVRFQVEAPFNLFDKKVYLSVWVKFTMVILHKITWQEFEKIKQILEKYKIKLASLENKSSWVEKSIPLFSQTTKQPYNVEVKGIQKEDLARLAAILDMWNVINSNNDDSCEAVSSKLQRAYFKEFNEPVFKKD